MATQSSQQTIIAQGVKVEGDFTSQGSVVIEGEVTGSVNTNEFLQVGESARIHADVTAADAAIAGEIKGNIHVNGRLDLAESSKVHGDIEAEVLTVAAGAKMNGKISMGGVKKAEKAEKAEEAKKV